MKAFAQLFSALDQTNKANDKVAILKDYFAGVSDEDKLWTLALFTDRRPKRQVNTTLIRNWAGEIAQLPDWLFQESYDMVGDLAETIALLLPDPTEEHNLGLSQWIADLNNLQNKDEDHKKAFVLDAWTRLSREERLVFNKLITGGFRIDVSQNLVVRTIAEQFDIDKVVIAHRITRNWTPLSTTFQELILDKDDHDDDSKPYPFQLAHPLERSPEELGPLDDWQVEWKWDGIRGQVVIRNNNIYIWLRGEELLTEKFPELHILKDHLPSGTVLDGEILPFRDGKPLPFALLQSRIGRKNLTKNIIQKAPVHLMVYDIMEFGGEDYRQRPMQERRVLLETLFKETIPGTMLSPLVVSKNWDKLSELKETARQRFAEGFMLKRKSSTYEECPGPGDWWKWKTTPLTIDGVMLYAQKGQDRKVNLYTNYTFGVWQGDLLVPFAKANSGLTDDEIRRVDEFVKQNTLERFGPVRTVRAELVFELAFEGINESSRHKSGVVLRLPRIASWREDKKSEDANTLEELKDLLKLYGLQET
ncbi:MAG: ATP-dependent DNA ligase [Roseivirga sp.]|nr:ATP-dependent DNA ligase [Roseivirga sp.]